MERFIRTSPKTEFTGRLLILK